MSKVQTIVPRRAPNTFIDSILDKWDKVVEKLACNNKKRCCNYQKKIIEEICIGANIYQLKRSTINKCCQTDSLNNDMAKLHGSKSELILSKRKDAQTNTPRATGSKNITQAIEELMRISKEAMSKQDSLIWDQKIISPPDILNLCCKCEKKIKHLPQVTSTLYEPSELSSQNDTLGDEESMDVYSNLAKNEKESKNAVNVTNFQVMNDFWNHYDCEYEYTESCCMTEPTWTDYSPVDWNYSSHTIPIESSLQYKYAKSATDLYRYSSPDIWESCLEENIHRINEYETQTC